MQSRFHNVCALSQVDLEWYQSSKVKLNIGYRVQDNLFFDILACNKIFVSKLSNIYLKPLIFKALQRLTVLVRKLLPAVIKVYI